MTVCPVMAGTVYLPDHPEIDPLDQGNSYIYDHYIVGTSLQKPYDWICDHPKEVILSVLAIYSGYRYYTWPRLVYEDPFRSPYYNDIKERAAALLKEGISCYRDLGNGQIVPFYPE